MRKHIFVETPLPFSLALVWLLPHHSTDARVPPVPTHFVVFLEATHRLAVNLSQNQTFSSSSAYLKVAGDWGYFFLVCHAIFEGLLCLRMGNFLPTTLPNPPTPKFIRPCDRHRFNRIAQPAGWVAILSMLHTSWISVMKECTLASRTRFLATLY